MTTREIQGHIEEIYGVEASPSLISAITDAVMEEVTAWQNRPLEPCYPIVFMDAIGTDAVDAPTNGISYAMMVPLEPNGGHTDDDKYQHAGDRSCEG
jgi:hypothetical protein